MYLKRGEKGVSMQVADAFATVARKSDWGSEVRERAHSSTIDWS